MARPGISTKNTDKIPLGPKFWNPKKTPPKVPKKYQKCAFLVFWGVFIQYFRGIFGGKFRESRISGRGGIFFGIFSWKFRVGPFRGSVAGRGVLKAAPKNTFVLAILCAMTKRLEEPKGHSPKVRREGLKNSSRIWVFR